MKIIIDRVVVEQVLEALKYFRNTAICSADIDAANEVIPNLEAALAEQPTSKPWVGLTEDERTDICDDYGANIHWRAFRAIEAKLQEKNT